MIIHKYLFLYQNIAFDISKEAALIRNARSMAIIDNDANNGSGFAVRMIY